MIVVWHADKPKYQNEVANRLGEMMQLFNEDLALKWFKAGMINLMTHWNTIDHHRHNKYLYLIRMCLTNCLRYVKEHPKSRKEFIETMKYLMSVDLSADGAVLQLMAVYIEELGKLFEVFDDMNYIEPLLYVLSYINFYRL
jgi:hypothetical protein